MSDNPNVPASVQYDDWIGTVAGDEVDLAGFDAIIGAEQAGGRALLVEIASYGGRQTVEVWGVKSSVTFSDLERLAVEGPIELQLLHSFESELPGHSDFNPPTPESLPVNSVGDVIRYGFKRFQLRIKLGKGIPDGAELVKGANTE